MQSNSIRSTYLQIEGQIAGLSNLGFSLEEIKGMSQPAQLELANLGKSKVNGEKIQRVTSPFAVDFSYRGESYLLVIDKGILTNLATVPRIFHWVINPDNKYVRQQAIAHDALVNEYEYPGGRLFNGYVLINVTKGISSQTVQPEFADIIFRELIEEGIRSNMKLKSWKAKAKAGICYAAIAAWRLLLPAIRIF